MPPTPSELLTFLLPGYLLTIAIEAPILFVFLSWRHALKDRAVAGVMLTACTYPVVVLVLPILLWGPFGHTIYISIAETFAPLAECTLFYWIWIAPKPNQTSTPKSWAETAQDFAAIVGANLASWLLGGRIVDWYLSTSVG